MARLGERAVVLGASMGGLLAARVLAEFFDSVAVVERDDLPDHPAVRRGVPQGRHVHVLLARGAQIFDELFPGLLDEMVAHGAPVWDDGELSKLHLSFGGHDVLRSGRVAHEPKALAIHLPSRPFLECHLRQRLEAMSNVTILSGHEVVQLTATADRRRVTGVRVVGRNDSAERELTADVVIDAMGRGARTPVLLENLGYGRPVEDHIVMHTNYVSQLLRIPAGTLREMLVDIGPAPDRPAGMFLSGYENDTWMFTVFGMVGHQPPRGLAGMLSFAEEYCSRPPTRGDKGRRTDWRRRTSPHALQPVAPLRQDVPTTGWIAGVRRRDLQLQPHLRPRNDSGRIGGRRAKGVFASRRHRPGTAILPCFSETDWRGMADGSELGPGLPGGRRAAVRMVARCLPTSGLGADGL